MKNAFPFLSIVVLLLSISYSTLMGNTNTPIKLEVKLLDSKKDYLRREGVWIKCGFSNISNDTILISQPSIGQTYSQQGNIRLSIIDKSGKEIDRSLPNCILSLFPPKYLVSKDKSEGYKIRMHELYRNAENWKKTCLKLAPGEKKYLFFDLSESVYYLDWYPGSYRFLTLTYESLLQHKQVESDYGTPVTPDYLPFWKGKIDIPVNLVINIDEPTGEEKEVLKMFLNASAFVEKVAKLYADIVTKHPHSIYAPRAQYFVIKLLKKESDTNKFISQDSIKSEIEKLIKLYPESPYSLIQKEEMPEKK